MKPTTITIKWRAIGVHKFNGHISTSRQSDHLHFPHTNKNKNRFHKRHPYYEINVVVVFRAILQVAACSAHTFRNDKITFLKNLYTHITTTISFCNGNAVQFLLSLCCEVWEVCRFIRFVANSFLLWMKVVFSSSTTLRDKKQKKTIEHHRANERAKFKLFKHCTLLEASFTFALVRCDPMQCYSV